MKLIAPHEQRAILIAPHEQSAALTRRGELAAVMTSPAAQVASFIASLEQSAVIVGEYGAPAVCSVTPTTLDFGTVTVGETSDKTFTIENTGAAE